MSFWRGDTGMVIKLKVTKSDGKARDLSTANTLEIKVLKPSGAVATKAATLTNDGKDGLMQFTVGAGDFDEVGKIELQGHVVTPIEDYHTSKHVEVIEEPLS